MVNLTAYFPDAVIQYSDNDWQPTQYNTTETSSSEAWLSFPFTGTDLYLFGYVAENANLSVTVDQPCQSNFLRNERDQPFLTRLNLPQGNHNVKITVHSQTFGLERVVWNDPNLMESNPAGQGDKDWTTDNAGFQVTEVEGARLELIFQGSAIAVQAIYGPESGGYEIYLDTKKKTVAPPKVEALQNVTLYRVDGLDYSKNCNLTLINQEQKTLKVKFHVYAPVLSASVPNSQPASTSTNTQTPTSVPTRQTLSQGGAAGIAISILLCVGLALFGLWFWIRKRQKSPGHFDKNHVIYDRMCSKCRQDIAGDYRLECVFPNCPAAVDLHPECRDWNTPEHHDHEVRRVKNE